MLESFFRSVTVSLWMYLKLKPGVNYQVELHNLTLFVQRSAADFPSPTRSLGGSPDSSSRNPPRYDLRKRRRSVYTSRLAELRLLRYRWLVLTPRSPPLRKTEVRTGCARCRANQLFFRGTSLGPVSSNQFTIDLSISQ